MRYTQSKFHAVGKGSGLCGKVVAFSSLYSLIFVHFSCPFSLSCLAYKMFINKNPLFRPRFLQHFQSGRCPWQCIIFSYRRWVRYIIQLFLHWGFLLLSWNWEMCFDNRFEEGEGVEQIFWFQWMRALIFPNPCR